MKKNCLFFCLFCLAATQIISAQTLARKGYIGIKAADLNDEEAISQSLKYTLGVLVLSIAPRSTADKLLLEKGDVITKINATDINNRSDLQKVQLYEDQKIKIHLWRNGQPLVMSGNVLARPLETDSISEVLYSEARTKHGGRIRTIVNKPRKLGTMPAILLITDYSCTSAETLPNTVYGFIIRDFCAKGYVVMRVEKSGMGDNQNTPACETADWHTEAKGYVAGLKRLRQYAFVDTNAIFIFGHGIAGSSIAPYVAAQSKPHVIQGVVVYGMLWRSWQESMLQTYRYQNSLHGISFPESERLTKTMHQCLNEWIYGKKPLSVLVQKKKYKDFINNDLSYNATQKTVLGRSEKFWLQLDSLPIAEMWEKAQTSTLALWGNYDVHSLAQDHEYLTRMMKENGYNSEFITIDSTNHSFLKTNSLEESIILTKSRDARLLLPYFNPKVTAIADEWLRKLWVK